MNKFWQAFVKLAGIVIIAVVLVVGTIAYVKSTSQRNTSGVHLGNTGGGSIVTQKKPVKVTSPVGCIEDVKISNPVIPSDKHQLYFLSLQGVELSEVRKCAGKVKVMNKNGWPNIQVGQVGGRGFVSLPSKPITLWYGTADRRCFSASFRPGIKSIKLVSHACPGQ